MSRLKEEHDYMIDDNQTLTISENICGMSISFTLPIIVEDCCHQLLFSDPLMISVDYVKAHEYYRYLRSPESN